MQKPILQPILHRNPSMACNSRGVKRKTRRISRCI